MNMIEMNSWPGLSQKIITNACRDLLQQHVWNQSIGYITEYFSGVEIWRAKMKCHTELSVYEKYHLPPRPTPLLLSLPFENQEGLYVIGKTDKC